MKPRVSAEEEEDEDVRDSSGVFPSACFNLVSSKERVCTQTSPDRRVIKGSAGVFHVCSDLFYRRTVITVSGRTQKDRDVFFRRRGRSKPPRMLKIKERSAFIGSKVFFFP